jgi:hypothetical protein
MNLAGPLGLADGGMGIRLGRERLQQEVVARVRKPEALGSAECARIGFP